MNSFSTSLILIGMPGAGKSTLGVILAKTLAKDFVDTDLLIQTQENRPLQEIIDTDGYLALRAIEEKTLLNMHYPNHVIATGGSAVYSESAMHHLRHFGPIIFLDVPLPELLNRITDFETRGLARHPNQSFSDLFNERRVLYQRYATITVDCSKKSQEQILSEIIFEEAESYTEKDA